MPSDLRAAARAVLERNTREGVKDGRRYRFTIPAEGQYPFQWTGWDSQFIAIVWATLGEPERAKEELRSIFAWQEPSGFIPHVAFWDHHLVRRSPLWWHYWETRERLAFLPGTPKPKTSAFTQPPVLAQAVERIVHVSGEQSFLHEALPALERYYRWLADVRDPDGNGLIAAVTQFETGVDYGTAFDETIGVVHATPLRLLLRSRWPQVHNKLRFGYESRQILRWGRYQIEDILMNSVFVQGLRALARLSEYASQHTLTEWANNRAEKTTEALLEHCYDAEAGLFFHRYGRTHRRGKTNSILSLMPLVIPHLPAVVVENLVAHLTNPDEYWTPYPVPSTPRNDPKFTPDNRIGKRRFLWRGPLTMSTNWFLVHGLRQYGYTAEADHIAATSRELVERHGFNEFFNPLTGEPVGAQNFGWATLVVDM